jgi:hypothetical protein
MVNEYFSLSEHMYKCVRKHVTIGHVINIDDHGTYNIYMQCLSPDTIHNITHRTEQIN